MEKIPEAIELKNYSESNYFIPQVDLCFDLNVHKTKVHTTLQIERNKNVESEGRLILDGENQELLNVVLDGDKLDSDNYILNDKTLVIKNCPEKFVLEIETLIDPGNNKTLSGLYRSGGMYCTQNEPEGMRCITYFIDRPDVMSKYRTKIIADKKTCPVLLSNGNPIERGDLDNDRHWVLWEDPFSKPAYLFALAAGDLGFISDTFLTMSGRKIELIIYCDKGNESRCSHAMDSLKKSMNWDEETYGLEYDLDIYMIVAVDSFNMGAMENKGLNIFNSANVLVDQASATDSNFMRVQEVIGHEYFHNWTGNRITCRDWFQLTLKEGLTVFRDQEFSSDLNSRSVERIKNVKALRRIQFAEDAGPMSHPIKPASYIEINNFYTMTIYYKGSEVIRMVHTILGVDDFRSGMDKYVELYDGQAVTTEDFINAMEQGAGRDLTQFKRWYSTAGTPVIDVDYMYNTNENTFTLTLEQKKLTNGNVIKKPFLIPLKFALIAENGINIPLNSSGETEKVLLLDEFKQEFIFEGIEERVIPSLNREFSAPVKVNIDYSNPDMIFLMAGESDDFNRWEAAQQLGIKLMKQLVVDKKNGVELTLDEGYSSAFGRLFEDCKIDNSFKALILTLPELLTVAEELEPFDYETTHLVREFMKKSLAEAHKDKLLSLYKFLAEEKKYSLDQKSIGGRALKGICLNYLMTLDDQYIKEACFLQYKNASNMTDKLSALNEIINRDNTRSQEVLDDFYTHWKGDNLVIDKWFALQALSTGPDTFANVKRLVDHPDFDKTVPNRLRSVVHSFANNYIHFHDKLGDSYKFIADFVVEIDRFNPQMAASLVQVFNKWKKLDQKRGEMIKVQLKKLMELKLSKNTYEIVSKALK